MKLLTLEEVVFKANKVHGGRYDYSSLEYKNTASKGVITCNIHGNFTQVINSHLNGHGCEKCARTKTRLLPTESIITRARSKHKGRYDYSRLVYTGYDNKVTIGCSIHGFFEQRVSDHLKGNGCPKCADTGVSLRHRDALEVVIEKAKVEHGDLYEYSRFVYDGSSNKSIVTCKVHGDFLQKVGDHIKGHGCPKCIGRISKPELELSNLIQSFGFNVETSNRVIIHPLELDLYIPDRNLAIEYCGLYWHNEVHKDKDYHHYKWKMCKDQGIQLITIFEDEWLTKNDVIRKLVRAKLGVQSETVHARKCVFIYTTLQEVSPMLLENHIQGPCSATYYTGLLFEGRLVATALFRRNYQGFELSRYCSRARIVGGLAKLIDNFRKSYKGQITTFSDHRYSNGQLYQRTGFTEVGQIKPDYRYVVGLETRHKFGFRRKHLVRKLKSFNPDLTEHENCLKNKVYRIYDCGKTKYMI